MNCRSRLCWLSIGLLFLSACASRPVAPVADVIMPGADVFYKQGMHVVADFKLGLHWQAIAPDHIAIIATTAKMTRIIEQAGLQLEIDREAFHLSAEPNKVDVSRQVFVVRLALVERMLSAQTVAITLLTSDGPLYGEFTIDPTHSAIQGFRETLLRIKRIRSGY